MNSLILTAHDYRTPRRANMHFIADELAARGPTRFFSLRYSTLSRWKHDARSFLDPVANRVERHRGVDCFLWKLPVHAFNTRRAALAPLETIAYRWTQAHPPETLVRWMREADTIFFESGSAVLHVDLAERVAPQAKRVYIASDDLETIGAAAFVRGTFERTASRMHSICLPSRLMAAGMPPLDNLSFVPHGIDPGMTSRGDPTPYDAPLNVVSVGSMLFDRRFFEAVAPAFPDVVFHVIGSGLVDGAGLPANVRVLGEMPHAETVRYIKHADVGIAPYAGDRVPAYLGDTSMKLMQYALFGVPAVCPRVVARVDARRFGYEPGDEGSMVDALRAALMAPPVAPPRFLSWSAVVDRLLDAPAFADTRMTATGEAARAAPREAVASGEVLS